MSRDPLQSLLRIRQNAVDEAQTAVADAYRAEQEAIDAVRHCSETLELEMREATSLAAGDEAVEAFARWLPIGRKQVADAHARQRMASANLDQVRTVLALARAGVRAVETTIQRKNDLAAVAERRKEQLILDDFATRR